MKVVKILIVLLVLLPPLCQAQDAAEDTTNAIVTLLPDMYYARLQEVPDPVIIDVRDNAHYKKYKLNGSVHAANKQDLYNAMDTLDREAPVFVYCEVGFRSNQATKLMAKEGFTTIYNLKKGIRNWKKEHFPVKKISRHERKKIK
ncbi:rhodanese-like domain-containing protein [Saccharicrinis sp. FJH54]|uniref:rhodanese-like domain-containing protein n=1 Tax=Saccharicrinis sp. FJH54 TaxID=3344665 RepID=UPI0035D3FF38